MEVSTQFLVEILQSNDDRDKNLPLTLTSFNRGYTMAKITKRNRWGMVDHSFLSVFITFAFIQFTNRGSGIIDGLFVSNFLDTDSIASVGIAKSIYLISGIISGLLSVGMQNRCAHELGKGDIKAFNRIFSVMFDISVAVSLVFGAAVMLGARPLAILMGATGNGAGLADGAAEYLRGIAIGIPPMITAMVLSMACQLDSAKTRVRKASIVYFVSNVVFDYIVVVLHLGVFGIALATSVAYYMQFGYLLLHFRTNDRMLTFTKFSTNIKEVLDILSLGTEKALTSLCNFISPVIVARIILLFGGTLAMSAYSIEKDLINFTDIFASAFANATALQAGVYFGEMNGETMHAMGRSVHKYCALFLGTTMFLFIFLSKPIAMLYISERDSLFNMVVYASVVTGIFAPVNGLVRSRISYLNSIKKVRNMQVMTVLSSVVYTIIVAFVLGSTFGSYGILTTDLTSGLLLMITVWMYYAALTKKAFPTAREYLAMPDTFNPKPGNIISLDIRDIEDVSLVSEQIQLFCKGHKADSGICMKAALCFEELAMNIINYGFPNCKRTPHIDFRLVFSEKEMVMRIRDNCPMFDVERYIAKQIDAFGEDGEPKLGLMMVSAMVENISYVHSLESNNVIIRFEF